MNLLLLIGSLLLAGSTGPGTKPAPAYHMVVHPNNPVTTLERRFLEDAFLKKVKTWPGGEVIRPVDREPGSEVRQRFTEEVLRRPLSAVRAYWQQRIFSGRDLPPPELETDEQVAAYVRKHPGAVGYLSGKASVEGLKVLPVH
jgi:ABC-type phosphate transport system substrate-binding protein